MGIPLMIGLLRVISLLPPPDTARRCAGLWTSVAGQGAGDITKSLLGSDAEALRFSVKGLITVSACLAYAALPYTGA